jgi:hypothetical protein
MAGVHEEVIAMLMGANRLIGGMGNAPSGGRGNISCSLGRFKSDQGLFSLAGELPIPTSPKRGRSTSGCGISASPASASYNRPEMMSGADTVLRIGAGAEPVFVAD